MDIRIDLQFTPCDVYIWLESRAEIINVSYRMDSAIAPGRHSASAERVDSSSVLVLGPGHSIFLYLRLANE